jgi:hypothetical protein
VHTVEGSGFWKPLRRFERVAVRRGQKWVLLSTQLVLWADELGFEEARRWLHGALCRTRTMLEDRSVGPYSQRTQTRAGGRNDT